ncbi:MAG: tRNA (adenosine(37)-N6)-dimethylallyltransferase MiaA [Spirochaetales bacterium]|nr:tRNA (adenosine(37)-N6)-dimethylallyltransferase MiaA [Spirochaetales bacterium]
MSKPKAVVLFGPTAVGKTAMTEQVFSEGFEIINADSVQVYKWLDIGSAKPDEELQKKIPHHLVDIRDPRQQYTAGDFCNDTERLIYEINSRGKMPLITGGTAYYFKQLIYGPSKTPAANMDIRKKVNSLIEERGADWAYEELDRVDHTAAQRIYRNDIYRISRALEVYYQTGRPLSSFEVSDSFRDDINFLVIGLVRDKSILDERIEKRVDIMFDMGLYDEMKFLIEMGADSSWPGMQGIGYKEFITAIESGETSIDLIKKDIVKNSKQYAKRQMTFFKSFKNVHFVDPDDIDTVKKLCKDFIER